MALLFSIAIGSADVVSDWNAMMVATVSGQSPFAQARFAAITQLAVFEAVNAITGDYKPYLGAITAPPGSSAEAAAIAAAHTVLRNYFPDNATSLDATQGKPLPEYARALALLNMAISDAAIAVFDTKYHYGFWRPESAIRAGETDDNPKTRSDPAFAPFIVAPCFPSYPSGHATLSNAAREVIEGIYGGGSHSITLSSPAVPGVTLEYSKLKQISADIDDARVYGGIHFRFDQDGGAEQGRRVGDYVHKNNLLRTNACNCSESE